MQLFFTGARWASIEVTGRTVGCPQVSLADPAAPPVARARFELTASGRGRAWSTERRLQFWRNFSAIDLAGKGAEASVLDFVRRHGDPASALERRALARDPVRTETGGWIPFIAWLGVVAKAWEAPDAEGISRRTDDAARIDAAVQALGIIAPPHGSLTAPEIEIVYSPHGRPGIGLRAKTLRAFMTTSAALALKAGIAMRRCSHCATWFELRRTDGLYCSATCQVTHSKERLHGDARGFDKRSAAAGKRIAKE